jgi:hypothetical protein
MLREPTTRQQVGFRQRLLGEYLSIASDVTVGSLSPAALDLNRPHYNTELVLSYTPRCFRLSAVGVTTSGQVAAGLALYYVRYNRQRQRLTLRGWRPLLYSNSEKKTSIFQTLQDWSCFINLKQPVAPTPFECLNGDIYVHAN